MRKGVGILPISRAAADQLWQGRVKINVVSKFAAVVQVPLVLVGSVAWINAQGARHVQSPIQNIRDFN